MTKRFLIFLGSMLVAMTAGAFAQQAPAPQPGVAQLTPEQAKQEVADWAAADIRIITPGVVNMSGLPDLTAGYTKSSGKKVAIRQIGMGTIVHEIQTMTPPADLIVLPFELMSDVSLDGGVVPGTFMPLGRNRMGLAVKAGAPHPDISTIEKLAAAMNGKTVMHSNPASRTMVAVLIDNVLKRPEFAGANPKVTTNGMEGGQALAKGEGDMAVQTISQILPYKEIELVGPLPAELRAWLDLAFAVSTRGAHQADAKALMQYLLRPEANSVWKPRGLERFN